MSTLTYRLLALDLDDTLLEDDLTIRDECVETIKEAQRAGVTVVVATGRMFQSALPYAKQLDLQGYLITYNGALIQSVSDEVLLHQPVSKAVAERLIGLADRHDLRLNFYIDDELYVGEVDERVRYYQQIAGVGVHPVGDLHQALKLGEPTKCLFVGEVDQIDELLPLMQQTLPELQVTRSKSRFIEMTRRGVHKYGALTYVAKKYGIPMEEVMAVGDGDNDIQMLQGAGLGVAVANASPGARQAADVITQASRGAGVMEAVRQFLLS